ncbi:MAG: ATP-dependent Clp protease proteolytic subunit [Balneola sp.]
MKDLGYNIKSMAGVIVLEIYGEIGYWDYFVEYLRWQINEFGEDAPLTVRVSSPGGDPRVGLSLYQIIRDHKGSTEGYIEYQCDSAATLPICACDYVLANKSPFEFMIHDPQMAMDWSTIEQGQALVDLCNKIRDDMVEAYVTKSGQSEAQIRSWMKETKFFTSQEALDAGFVDEIKEVDQTLSAKVDYKLAASAHADVRPKEFEIKGRGKSPEPNQQKQIKSKMEEFFKKMKAAFGLGDTSDEADVVIRAKELKAQADKVEQLETDNATLTQERDDALAKVAELEGEEPTQEELEQQAEQEVDAQLEAAVKGFKITASAKENYAKTYAGKPDDLKAALELIPEGAAKPSKATPEKRTSARAGAGVHPKVADAWSK